MERSKEFYVTMGKVLFEKTQQAQIKVLDGYPEKETKKEIKKSAYTIRLLNAAKNNDYALAYIAKQYEHNVENSDDPELIAQHESIVIEVRGRLGIE
jgi:hypothetical protein